MDTVKLRIRELAKNGLFGPGKLIRVRNTSDDDKGMQFMSQLFFLCVEMESVGEVEEKPIVVKIRPVVQDELDAENVHSQFINEVNFYAKVLPEFGPLGINMCAKMYFGYATSGKDYDDDLIVLEDLRASGFILAKDLFLDKDHINLAMRRLGEFHGLSYSLKKSSPHKLQEFARKMMREPHFDCDNGLLAGGFPRGFKVMIEENPDDYILKKAYDKISTGSCAKQWQIMRKPEEPYAVIAHGDFNKNNFMYGYDSDGKVRYVKFFDFGTALYSDPSVDISFFLYINTTADSREQHWDEYLRAYWDGVISVEESPGFSFEQFLKQFAKRAVWGYFPCCFYLPMLMSPDDMPKDFQGFGFEDWKELSMNLGGKEGEIAIAGILRHLHKKGYLQAYVEHFNG